MNPLRNTSRSDRVGAGAPGRRRATLPGRSSMRFSSSSFVRRREKSRDAIRRRTRPDWGAGAPAAAPRRGSASRTASGRSKTRGSTAAGRYSDGGT